ncbi:hypothetical protein D9619_011452 [Psilocybe cf. subviscida]|uniref:Uncharacterized protein n=1 Tax=Psilocybe cf. subviscida TaxID=2480587 RepID=A0A8H5BSR5_9AGAR|nr:hypothetical protein D9619_011452 [Psilocybe cf. subviscida]
MVRIVEACARQTSTFTSNGYMRPSEAIRGWMSSISLFRNLTSDAHFHTYSSFREHLPPIGVTPRSLQKFMRGSFDTANPLAYCTTVSSASVPLNSSQTTTAAGINIFSLVDRDAFRDSEEMDTLLTTAQWREPRRSGERTAPGSYVCINGDNLP